MEQSEAGTSHESSSVGGSGLGRNDSVGLVEYLVRNRWMELDLGEELEEYFGECCGRGGREEVTGFSVLGIERTGRNAGKGGRRCCVSRAGELEGEEMGWLGRTWSVSDCSRGIVDKDVERN